MPVRCLFLSWVRLPLASYRYSWLRLTLASWKSPASEVGPAEAIDHEDGPRRIAFDARVHRLDALQRVAERFRGSIENDDKRFGAEEAQRGDESRFTKTGSCRDAPQVDVDALDRRRRRRVGGRLARLGADRGVRQGQAEQRR